MKVPLCMVDLAQTIEEWKDIQSVKVDDQVCDAGQKYLSGTHSKPKRGKRGKISILRDPPPSGNSHVTQKFKVYFAL